MNDEVFYRIISIPQNIVMDLNNITMYNGWQLQQIVFISVGHPNIQPTSNIYFETFGGDIDWLSKNSMLWFVILGYFCVRWQF